MVEGFKYLVLHYYCTKCERYRRACYVNRIFLGVSIFAFSLGQKVRGLTLDNFWNTKQITCTNLGKMNFTQNLYKVIKFDKFVMQFHAFEKNSKLKNYGF
jgi:hypothetical protein